MQIVRTIPELRLVVDQWRRDGLRIGLVPTMGGLHSGHLSLVQTVKPLSDKTVATIFVNPTQFAPHEDFDSYPRDEKTDSDLLNQAGTDLLFAPDTDVMYPKGSDTTLNVGKIGTVLEGEFRPHFFGGVATIVTKLFMQCLPDVAVFGEKDYQQLCVIRQFSRDLDIPVEIVGCPTLREPDGLAMSSRNRYLTPRQRLIAVSLSRALEIAAAKFSQGIEAEMCEMMAKQELLNAGFDSVDYIAIRDAETLEPLTLASTSARILGAATLGKTRLIDNLPV